jgi:RNA polymerase-interacting CarD/CdnL/TRCF family regulator
MFVKAKKILISELMYAKGLDEEETAEWLDEVLLSDVDTKKRAKAGAAA